MLVSCPCGTPRPPPSPRRNSLRSSVSRQLPCPSILRHRVRTRRRALGDTLFNAPKTGIGENHMSTLTVKDGTAIYYKDWGSGQPIVFSHGWPLSADDWDTQMLFFLNHGYRVIAHDRRGHGRSSQTADGHDMDHYADDLAALTEHLDLMGAIHVGHSTGGGEVVRYLARHGERRVTKAALLSAVPPLMLKT